jgi:hypothetical protein
MKAFDLVKNDWFDYNYERSNLLRIRTSRNKKSYLAMKQEQLFKKWKNDMKSLFVPNIDSDNRKKS